MANKLFGSNIEPACEYCVNGKKSENEMILCAKVGVVDPSFCCKKFDYDPLKRKPHKMNHKIKQYSLQDFKI